MEIGIREIYVLLIITILVGTVGNALSVYTNYEIMERQNKQIMELIHHAEAVDQHINATNTTVEILEQNHLEQAATLETFKMHVNHTATAAPLVAENNEMLKQILNELRGNVTQ